MDIFVLASGSKGNMTLVKNENTSFFIDAGISYQKIESKMKAYGEDIDSIDTLFLTHEHADHILGLKSLLKSGSIKRVYLTQGTLDALNGEIKPFLPEYTIIRADVKFYHF